MIGERSTSLALGEPTDGLPWLGPPSSRHQERRQLRHLCDPSAFHTPVKDEAQLIAFGRFASKIVAKPILAGAEEFPQSAALAIQASQPERKTASFRPLVPALGMIRQKETWSVTN